MIAVLLYLTGFADMGGLFGGKFFGKDNFAKSISPAKTVQGIYGVFGMAIVISLIFWGLGQLSDGYVTLKFPLIDYLSLAVITAFLSILGDLCESFLKRCSNVKDSGHILQDHGGLLDRIDSTLLNAPFYFWFTREYVMLRTQSDYDVDCFHLLNFFINKGKWVIS